MRWNLGWGMLAMAGLLLPMAAQAQKKAAKEKAEAGEGASFEAAQEMQRKFIKKFDTNDDGMIDDAEKAQAAKQLQKDFKDGNIDPREMALMREFMMRMQGPGGGKPPFGPPGGPGPGGAGLGGAGLGGVGPGIGPGGIGIGGGNGLGGFDGGDGNGMNGPTSFPPDVIKKFDKNKDGELDEKEQKAALAAFGPKKSRAQQIKDKQDADGDGKVTKAEREAYAEQLKAEAAEKKEEKKVKSKKKDE